jgi:hypothetical protein
MRIKWYYFLRNLSYKPNNAKILWSSIQYKLQFCFAILSPLPFALTVTSALFHICNGKSRLSAIDMTVEMQLVCAYDPEPHSSFDISPSQGIAKASFAGIDRWNAGYLVAFFDWLCFRSGGAIGTSSADY